jgi:hypothetical protein
MSTRPSRRPSPALVVASLALLVALSGVGYAAVVPRASVGTPQLKRNAVTSPKIKDATIRKADIQAGVLPPRLLSRTGSIPRGLTIRGAFLARMNTETVGHAYSFGVQLASAPAVHYINNGNVPPAECPGTKSNPQALPGHLCLYESNLSANVTSKCVMDTTSNVCGTANRWGFGLSGTGTANGTYFWGTWAVTSP